MSHPGSNYSRLDRLVHRLAMSQLEVQQLLSRLEDKQYRSLELKISANNPVFITSLPRAGTTLLLETLLESRAFASHSYRNMPFVLCPLFWDTLSRGFHKHGNKRERAHGDGMLIGYDSAEAFEEILWLTFWPEHFKAGLIEPWHVEDIDSQQQFVTFLQQHMRKLIHLQHRKTGTATACRYLSKNNNNIARLQWLETHFPDAIILVPFREPFGHISSLHTQHKTFLQIHEQDPFALHYMESIGHMEFGKALRPINFSNWIHDNHDLEPGSLDFWAEYWIVAYQHILTTAGPGTRIFSYDRLCTQPGDGLGRLEQELALPPGSLVKTGHRFRAPTRYQRLENISPTRVQRLQETHERLQQNDLLN